MRSTNKMRTTSDPENGIAAVALPPPLEEGRQGAAPAMLNGALANDRLHIAQGRSGDHVAVHHFLLATMQGPSVAEYQSLLDEPFYEPSNRLLIKRDHRILSHVHLSQRSIYLDSQLLPVSDLTYLATLPEYRHRGLTAALLADAERMMVSDGSVMGRMRTSNGPYFQQTHWFVFGRHSYSLACPRDILSCLEHRRSPEQSWQFLSRPKVSVRLWRHVEQDALVRLYNEAASRCNGGLQRQESYWRWLVSRQAYDRIYVAVRGEEKVHQAEANDNSDSTIIGYAVMRKGQIAELIVEPNEEGVGERLIERACADAIERDDHTIRLDAPPNDPLHQLLVDSGGSFHCHEADQGQVTMAKVFDPIALLQSMKSTLYSRAKRSSLPRSFELGLLCNGEKLHLCVNARNIKFCPGKLGRSYLALEGHTLSQGLLGHLDIADEVNEGRIEASTATAIRAATTLFPRLPLWRPPLDDLPAG